MNIRGERACTPRRRAIGPITAVRLLSHPADSQERGASTAQDILGFETEVFPILSEGYHISLWYGFKHIRLRAFVAWDRVPQFAVQEGFKNNVVLSYALMIDFFPAPGICGCSLGAGIQYWDATVSLDGAMGMGEYSNTVLSVT
jgi:hypothetical protein